MTAQMTPDLVLILPDGITEPGALRTLAEAIQEFRASVLGEAIRLDQVAAAAGDPVRHMLFGSQADAYRETIGRLDEAISEQLDQWNGHPEEDTVWPPCRHSTIALDKEKNVTSSDLRAPCTDLLLHSPDGEHRGMLARAGDLFPLDPAGHLLLGRPERGTPARPWGLRHLTVPRASKHGSGKTNETSEGSPDGQGPQKEETQSD